ncbi:MAG: prefoldin subunit, partial [Candidatus Micrarchaeota archaeon]|nr:prefoldin subunit [Candidatus Micrarchaeota archaeon]
MADEDLQKLAQEYQGLQQQLQMVLVQRQQLAMQQNELEQAQKETESSNGPFYRFIGNVLVGRDKSQLSKELGDEKAKVVERNALFEAQEKKL